MPQSKNEIKTHLSIKKAYSVLDLNLTVPVFGAIRKCFSRDFAIKMQWFFDAIGFKNVRKVNMFVYLMFLASGGDGKVMQIFRNVKNEFWHYLIP